MALPACVTGAGTAAKPTALELQLLGAYEELDDDLASVASVRAGNDPTTSSFVRLEALALEGRATQRYNEDDVQELKRLGCVAETLQARITARECPDAQGAVARRLTRVVEEENRARRDILTWAAWALARRDGRPGPTEQEVEELKAAYRRLQYESAEPGHLVEQPGGGFSRVE